MTMTLDDSQSDDCQNQHNLLVSVIRAPLMGIQWLIGNNTEPLHDDANCDHSDRQRQANFTSSDAISNSSSSSYSSSSLSSIPSSRGSLRQYRSNASIGSFGEFNTINRIDSRRFYRNSKGLKSKKELSWSDEMGKKLVEYGDESTINHEPRLTAEPAKSALIRTMSMKSDANAMLQTSNETDRYPRPTPYDEHVKYPRTAPYDGSDLSSGTYGGDSPQWGWYTHHTTPPTPEYYNSRPTRKHGSSASNSSSQTSSTQNSDSTSDSSGLPSPPVLPVAPQPNPVFRILQKKYKANPNAWNVPC